MKKIAVVIRAYNEAGHLRKLFPILQSQNYSQQDVEYIVVDNGSQDDTTAVAKQFGATVVYLVQEEFSYPKSLNLGIAATSVPIVCLLSAHAFPFHAQWLATAVNYLNEPLEKNNVAGIYGTTIPNPPFTVAEAVIQYPGYFYYKMRGPKVIHGKTRERGLMQSVCAAIRRELWQVHPYDERYGAGSEDGEWGGWALNQGYSVVFDPDFSVRHSHQLGWREYMKQLKLWNSLPNNPRPFDPEELKFRKDITRNT